MALIQYNLFYRMFGIRRIGQLVAPPLPMLSRLQIPANSYYHYIGVGPLDDGPTEDEAMLAKARNRTFALMNVTELGLTNGNPKRLPIPIDRTIRQFRQRNPRFRPMRDLATTERDQQVVGVFNYSLLHRLYRYPRNIYSNFYRWQNIHEAVWEKIAQVAKASTRNQFIEFELPGVLPSVSMLNQAEHGLTQKLATIFSNSEAMILLELWKWLGENRGQSMISKIPLDKVDRVNLVFRESNRWFVVNLGQLNTWRLPTKEEVQTYPDLAKKHNGYDAHRMQRFALRLMMALTAARDDSVAENLGDEKEDTKDVVPENQLKTEATPTITKVDASGKTTKTPVPVEAAARPPQPNDTPQEEDNFLSDSEKEEREADNVERNAQVLDDEIAQQAEQKKHEEQVFQTNIDEDLATLADIADNAYVEAETESEVKVAYTPPEPKTPEEAIIAHANALADAGGWPATDYKRAIENAGKYKLIEAPDKTPLGDFIQIHPHMTQIHEVSKIPDKVTVVDKSMLQSSHLDLDPRYVTNLMQRDIANMAVSMQNAGILVQDYRSHVVEDITGGRVEYALKIKPLVGAPSTLRWSMPKVEADGSYRINNVLYRTRKQRGDLPIRKLKPNLVALTSYYGKVFIERSTKKVNDYGRWIREAIMRLALGENTKLIPAIDQGNCFDHLFEAPRLYTQIAQGFRGFDLLVNRNGQEVLWKLVFDHKRMQAVFQGTDGTKIYQKVTQNGKFTVIGNVEGTGLLLVMDKNNAIYEVSGKGEYHPMPSLEELLGISESRAPLEFTEVRVFGKMIPIGVVLSYLIGLEELCKRLGVKPRIVPTGQRPGLLPGDWTIPFQDEVWIFNREDVVATLILSGWREYRDSTHRFDHHEFNRRDVYFNVLEDGGLSVRYLREMDLLAQMFIDPITKELLAEMKEPQVFTELLVRASELLQDDQHPHELDAAYMRSKGYERFAGELYKELVNSIRVHNARGAKAVHPVEMNPYAVWIRISEDPAKDQALEINPIKELKEIEAITYAGTGGRSGRAMVKRTRAYHPSDMGLISEATSDSSDVGINTFMTADPMFNSLRGTTSKYEIGKEGATRGLSTSALLAPAADRDDMKRANFISIQNAHGMACVGYHQAQVRTGYESVIPYRVGATYAVMAKKNGKVTGLNSLGVIVTYADGEVIGVEIGRKYGNAAGLTIPHEIITPLKLGDEFEAGDPIAYNSGFFEPDFFNPKNIVLKFSMTAKTVLLESSDTLEDSCAISTKLSDRMRTRITKMRTIIVNFNQQIHDLVSVGDNVEYDSILCVIEDAVSASSGVLDESTVDTLKVLTSQAPQAKLRGKVERVEVFYHGEKEDMSPTLRAISSESDQRLTSRLRSQGKRAFNGRVDENYRVENDALQIDSAAINVYISAEVSAGVGDKGVFGNQLKTVFGRVFSDNVKTESGTPIDAVFGAKSVDDRIVQSPFIIGTTTTLLNVIAKKAVELYEA